MVDGLAQGLRENVSGTLVEKLGHYHALLALLRQILASADHDPQIWRRPNSSYDAAKSPTGDGEAVGITYFKSKRAATLRQPRSADARNPAVRSD